MGNWFDGLAKRSARSAQEAGPEAGVVDSGLTRRQVLARGAAVTGAAWTAPMLLSVQPAWAVTSCPRSGEVPTQCNETESICCPEGQGCFTIRGKFACDIEVGDPCGNNGFGTCNGGVSTCNQVCKDNATKEPICGGAGSTCGRNADCAEGRTCASSGFCGGVGAACTSDAECSPGTCANNNVNTVCGPSGTCVAA